MFNEIYSPNSSLHIVKKGDTLWMLSQTYGVSVQSIIEANPGVNANNLQIGSTLYIPATSAPPTSPHACPDNTFPYIVQAGNTLWMLSQAYGVSVQSILDFNPGINPQNLQIGSTLCIPSQPALPTPPAPPKQPKPQKPPTPLSPPVTCPNGTFPYIVQAGDTLWMLSQAYNVSIQNILNLNPDINPQNLQIGSTLCIPNQPALPTPPAPLKQQKQQKPPTPPSPPSTCPNGAFPYIVQAGDTLWMLSQAYGVSVQSILDLNPGINPQNLQIGSTLCIPSQPSLPTPPAPLKQQKPPTPPSPPTTPKPPAPSIPPNPPITCPIGTFPYIIQAGDTLWMLSQAYGVSVQSIFDLNPGINPQNLQIGSTLCIPTPSAPPSPPTPPIPSTPSSPSVFPYLIKKCDTLCGIARKFYVSVESILQKNPGINPKCLQAGTYIYVPISCCGENTCRYAVRKCDTLNSIANKFNVCPSDLIAANPNINFQHLVKHQIICIPNIRMF